MNPPFEARRKNSGSVKSNQINTKNKHRRKELANMDLIMLFNLMILMIASEMLPILFTSVTSQSVAGNDQVAANETRELLPVAQPFTINQVNINNSETDNLTRSLVAAASTTTFSIDSTNEPNAVYNHQQNNLNENLPLNQVSGAADSKLDRLAQSVAANAQYQQHNHHNHHQHHHHSNHQNYPLEPYPSASYASLVTAAPPSSYLFSQQGDRHQSSSNHQLNDYNEGSNTSQSLKFNNSFGNQSPLSNLRAINSEPTAETNNNHAINYGTSSSSGLNTGLIQNLTASLFPVNQLSNATLLSLSDLLNKTRQVGAQLGGNHQFSNGYRPSASGLNELGYPASNYFTSNQQQPNSLAEQQYGIFDYNHFGFREAGSQYHQASPGGPLQSFRPQHKQTGTAPNNQLNFNDNSLNGQNNNLRSGYKTSSNIYNTYLPYKDSLNSMPTMTNGQSLSMALYDSYLDNNGYKAPLVVNGLPKAASSNSNYGHSLMGYNSNNPALQYIQQHNINNQNQLDKIVYHSTPFRPSIVSPPLSSPTALPSPFNPTSNAPPAQQAAAPSSTSSASSSSQVRLKTDEKPMPFASLSSSSSTISDAASKADGYNPNEQSNKLNRYSASLSLTSKDQTARTTTETSKSVTGSGGSTTSAPPANNAESFEAERRQNVTSAKASETGSGSKTISNALQHPNPKEAPGNPSLSTGQAILFDLYEREIDNQIREAIYGTGSGAGSSGGPLRAHQSDPMMSSMRLHRPQRPIVQPTNLVYDEMGSEPHNPLAGANWDQPVALGSQETNYLPGSFGNNRARPLMTPGQLAPISMDPLSAALQELPTFSASDLQPIFPNAPPSYSMLPASSASVPHESFAPENSLAALTSHLFPLAGHNSAASNHHHLYGHDTGTKFISMSHQPHGSYSSSTQAPDTGNHQSSGSSMSLPALLLKLHSSPLSSILSGSLTHLYDSLPRNRNKKPVSSSGQHSNKQTAASQASHSFSLAPSPFFGSQHSLGGLAGKQLFKVLGASTDTMAPSSSHKSVSIRQQQQLHQQQQQEAATLAAATASILAAELPLSPLQTALLQAQAANMYLGANAVESPDLQANSIVSEPVVSGPSALDGLGAHTNGYGLAGGGISPLIWRGIFSPTYWARKQSTTSSGQTTSSKSVNQNQQTAATAPTKSIVAPPLSLNPLNSAHHQGSHQSKSAATSGQSSIFGPSKSQLQSPRYLPLSSFLRGSLASQYLFNPITSASSTSGTQQQGRNQASHQQQLSLAGTSAKVAQFQKKPRLKIKILKIPIAFYDQPAGVSGSQASAPAPFISQAADLTSASADGATFLAGLPCPLSHTGYQPPHTFEQHLLSQNQILGSSTDSLTALSALLPAQQAAPLLSSFQFASPHLIRQALAPGNVSIQESPSSISIQGFTDINQPNDLQVSPTTNNNQGKLYKTAL